jgi:hypothetical protein
VQEIWQQERQASAFQEGILMIGFLIVGIGAIAGLMLGLRFKVLILVPAILLATAAITVTGIVSGYEVKAVALTVFGTAASLQIGYIAGYILYVVVLALLPARTATHYRGPRSEQAPRAEPR